MGTAALTILALPPLVVVSSGTATLSGQWTALRIVALLALTLLFVNVVTGAARPLFNSIFPPRKVYVFHNFTGLTALLLALGHGILALVYGVSGYKGAYVALGPAVLILLAVTVSAALARRRIKRLWRPLHRLNYLLFVVALTHAWLIGFDLKYGQDRIYMQVMTLAYTAIAAAAAAYRLYLVIKAEEKKRAQVSSPG